MSVDGERRALGEKRLQILDGLTESWRGISMATVYIDHEAADDGSDVMVLTSMRVDREGVCRQCLRHTESAQGRVSEAEMAELRARATEYMADPLQLVRHLAQLGLSNKSLAPIAGPTDDTPTEHP